MRKKKKQNLFENLNWRFLLPKQFLPGFIDYGKIEIEARVKLV